MTMQTTTERSALTDERKADLHAFWEGALSGKVPPEPLPIPESVKQHVEADIRADPRFWTEKAKKRSLESLALTRTHPGIVVVTMQTPRGLAVLAVGSDEMGEFHAWCPRHFSGRTLTQWVPIEEEAEEVEEDEG